jgi:hypothetical protein
MKTLKTLSALVFAAGILFTSCKKTDNTTSTTPPVSKNPTITLIGGTGYTSSDYTTTVGAPSIKIGYTAISNTSSGSKLDHVYTSITSNNVVTYSTTTTFTTSITSHADSIIIPTSTAGTARVEFTVTDKAGLTAVVGINITVVAASPAIMPIGTGTTAITLGGTVDTNPSYINMYTGATLKSSQVTTSNAASIDLAYSKTKIYSPSDALETNTTVKGAGVITKLDVYTAKAYSAITAADIAAYTPTGATNVTLANGTVIMFKTAAGKNGVFQVTAFNGSATSTTTDNISIVGQIQQ